MATAAAVVAVATAAAAGPAKGPSAVEPRSHIRTLPPTSQLQESLRHLGSRAPEKSDRLRYTNITQGQYPGGLSLTGVGLHPGPGLFGGPSVCEPGQEVDCPAGAHSTILTTGHQRVLAGKVS